MPGQRVGGPGRTFTPQDVFALAWATDVRISPDGHRVAYVRVAADIMTDSRRQSGWLLDVASGEQSPLHPGAASSPRWSPDGKHLAYVAAGADGKPQVFVCEADLSRATRLTGLPEAPGVPTWSPDGRAIAFTMFVPEAEDPALGTPLEKPEGPSPPPARSCS